jgi:hypothetical protein
MKVFGMEIKGNAAKEFINDKKYLRTQTLCYFFCSVVLHILISSSIFCELEAQSRQSTISFLSSRSNWDFPTRRRVCIPPSLVPGGGTLAFRRWGGWVPIPTRGQALLEVSLSRMELFFLYVSLQSAILYV